jgi:uncharacterized protein (UPF0261 family)
MRPSVLVIATFDTKEPEARFLAERIEHAGCETVLMNPGILAPARNPVDIDRDEVAEAAGSSIAALEAADDKSLCINTMIKGSGVVARRLHDEGRISGVIAIGGAQGTNIGTAAMRALPFGVPKFMVSTVASGQATFGPFVDTRDIIMMHSVADIQGLNTITRRVLTNAANAVVGMVTAFDDTPPGAADRKGSVAVSMLGTTTPGALVAKEMLEARGYDFVAFHQNGTGGIAMEDMLAEGLFVASLDINLHEIGDRYFGGLHGAIRDYRLESAGRLGIPQVVAPGSINYTVLGPYEEVSAEMKARPHIIHNPTLTLVRLTPEELTQVGRITAEKLNRARGPVHVYVPLRGFSFPDREGGEHWWPEGNEAFIASLKRHLDDRIPYDEVDAHINDREFVEIAVIELLSMLDSKGAQT